MHRPRQAHTIFSLRFTALLLCLNRVLVPAAVLLLLASAATANISWSVKGMILAGVAVVFAAIQWIYATAAKCPLCMMPVLSRRGCSRHRSAKRFAGSHRLPVAFGILFQGHFRCPYCNEPTLLRLKDADPGHRF